MSDLSRRMVFDCNVYFQALTSPQGPAGRLLDLATGDGLLLIISEQTLEELRDVTSRPYIVKKYVLEPTVVARFIKDLEAIAICLDDVPHVFDLARDPDDAHYIDLALAANARLVVSRDKDLLSLRDSTTVAGREFITRFPQLSILTPPEALRLFDGAPPELA